MDDEAIARELHDMALQLRGAARSTDLDEESMTQMLLAAAELSVLAKKIESAVEKPARRSLASD